MNVGVAKGIVTWVVGGGKKLCESAAGGDRRITQGHTHREIREEHAVFMYVTVCG